jgi:hypothetical protein
MAFQHLNGLIGVIHIPRLEVPIRAPRYDVALGGTRTAKHLGTVVRFPRLGPASPFFLGFPQFDRVISAPRSNELVRTLVVAEEAVGRDGGYASDVLWGVSSESQYRVG